MMAIQSTKEMLGTLTVKMKHGKKHGQGFGLGLGALPTSAWWLPSSPLHSALFLNSRPEPSSPQPLLRPQKGHPEAMPCGSLLEDELWGLRNAMIQLGNHVNKSCWPFQSGHEKTRVAGAVGAQVLAKHRQETQQQHMQQMCHLQTLRQQYREQHLQHKIEVNKCHQIWASCNTIRVIKTLNFYDQLHFCTRGHLRTPTKQHLKCRWGGKQ